MEDRKVKAMIPVSVEKSSLHEEQRLGNIYGENKGSGFAGNVWDKEFISPALTTMQGGGRQPMITEIKALDEQNQCIREETFGTLTTDGSSPKHNNRVCEIVAMRGRDPENPSDRTSGNPNLEQTLEIREDGCTNTLTTVQKDNMVLETVGYLGDKRRQSTAVYSEEGIGNTLSTAHGSGNGYILVKQATKEGTIKCDIGGVVDLNYPDSQTRRGRVQGNGQISPTLTTENIPSVLEPWVWEIDGVTYLIRIRKLTPRECWRLMSFRDEDFDKAEKVNSNTQLYKEAGNSIVTEVLCRIFEQMF